MKWLADGTVTFKYDPMGRRIYKSSSSGTSIFAYDGDNMIEETNTSGTVVSRYAQTQNIDEPLAMLRGSATSFYDADGTGGPGLVVELGVPRPSTFEGRGF
jgi:Tfp pilus assembly protein FimT